ncbi:zinc-binding dehydrogenase [Jatrophihabitans sp. YIM 134969]
MRAAVLEEFGRPLTVGEVTDPVAAGGEVLVDVLAACVLPYAAEVFSGARAYPLVPPVVSGCGAVGRVVTVGPDATSLRPGDLVWCDPTVRSRDDARTPDITLQGWSARGEGGAALARHFHDGPLAERMVVPTENVERFDPGDLDLAHWAGAVVPLVPYGGLLAADLQAGETVVVSGATGNFGSAAVAVALAMGAGRVVAAGRNGAVLDRLADRFGARVVPVRLTSDPDTDGAAIRAAAAGPVDVVLDLLPPEVDARVVRTAAMTVREFGRVVLMGGVGMLGGDDLALPYPWLMRNSVTVRGRWMAPRTATGGLIRLVHAGLLDLAADDVTTFDLDAANDAVAHAAAHGGPFQRTVVLPHG